MRCSFLVHEFLYNLLLHPSQNHRYHEYIPSPNRVEMRAYHARIHQNCNPAPNRWWMPILCRSILSDYPTRWKISLPSSMDPDASTSEKVSSNCNWDHGSHSPIHCAYSPRFR